MHLHADLSHVFVRENARISTGTVPKQQPSDERGGLQLPEVAGRQVVDGCITPWRMVLIAVEVDGPAAGLGGGMSVLRPSGTWKGPVRSGVVVESARARV